MAFARPTFDELVTRIAADLRAQLLARGRSVDPLLRRTKMWVLARVYAAVFHVLYGALQWLSLQILPSTATDRDYLVSHGRTYSLAPIEATAATGVVRFTGVNGTAVGTDVEIVRLDGAIYRTTSSGTISGGQADLDVEASEEGIDGMAGGTELQLVSPIAGIDSVVTVVSGFTDGLDDESTEAFRTRVLERTRLTPHGGARDDYVLWAREVAGVTAVQPAPNARGPGTVDVYFLFDTGTSPGIPNSGHILTVQEHLDEVRPVTADVRARAPGTVAMPIEFSALTPDTPENRTAIEDALGDFVLAAALEFKQTVYLSELYAAVGGAADVDFALAAPLAAVTCTTGEVIVLGGITWPA